MLVEATGFRYRMRYAEMGYPGAPTQPYLHPKVLDRLQAAAANLPEGFELLIWDAYRPPQAQRRLYDLTIEKFVAKGMSPEQAAGAVRGFVAHPDRVFPHGTGGAVDLTLFHNGREANMGTDFDDFSALAARDWYRENPTARELDPDAAHNREVLYDAMEKAGFVGLDSEWWHYEFGTGRWGVVTGQTPFLTTVLTLP